MTMKRKRILFTGGSGKAGRHVVPWLLEAGYWVVNVDLTPLDHPGVDNLTADITDSGQMFNVLTSYANFDELEPGTGVPRFDAVVHFAAVPRILLKPDNETFRVNTVGTYNVIEAATKLGIDKIIVASSETTYGVCFADGQINPIEVTRPAQSPVRVVGSRSHRGELVDAYLEKLGDHVMVSMGSSLKLCLVASGEADVYPRLGLTSGFWDLPDVG